MPGRRPINPFYVALVVIAVAFGITSCAFVVLMLRTTQTATAPDSPRREEDGSEAPGGLIDVLDAYGEVILAVELAALAVATVGVIATDDYWNKRAAESSKRPGSETVSSEPPKHQS